MPRRILMWGLALLLVAGVASCGGAARDSVAVTVGPVAITARTVDHWARVLAREGGSTSSSARARALEMLISSEWIVEEAADLKVPVSNAELARKIAEKQGPAKRGEGALAEVMKWTGRSLSDLKYEIRTELAATNLRHYMAREEAIAARIPRAQILRYYNHEPQYFHRERRTFNFVEYLPSLAAGRRLVAEIKRGRSIADVSVTETRERPSPLPVPGDSNAQIHTAIFRAPPHVLLGPLPWSGVYALFEVTRILPPGREPFAQVRGAIEQRLAGEAREKTHAAMLAAWRSRWRALTSCVAGFIVPLCSQYAGAVVSEPDPFTTQTR